MTKDESVDTLRGIAIILVISLHISNDAPLASAHDFYEFLSCTFRNVRMPLFTVISGYLFAARPLSSGAYASFVEGKLRRIFLPLVCVSTIEFLVTALAPDIHNPPAVASIWRVYVLPYDAYWFLQSIFMVFLLIGLVESRGLITTPQNWLIAIAASVVLHLIHPLLSTGPDFLNLRGASYLLPFFLVGLGIRRFQSVMMASRSILIAGIVFLITFGIQQLNCLGVGFASISSTSARLLGLGIGTSACMMMFKARWANRTLASVGSYAYTIYLFEDFGAGAGRRLLNIAGINPHVYFLGVLMGTLLFGILIEKVIGKVPYASTFLLGKPWPTSASLRQVRA